MKNTLTISLIFTLTSLSAAQAGTERYKVISDLDDTIKLTHVESTPAMVWNGIFTAKAFAGTTDLFNALAAKADVVIMSASPKFLRARIKHFVKKNDFPPNTRIILKPRISDDTYSYKMETLNQLAQEDTSRFILIGDDSERDAFIYTDFARQNPGRVAAIYIRSTLGRVVPQGATAFNSNFEVALLEHQAGRISLEAAVTTGMRVLEAPWRRVLPKFVACPDAPADYTQAPELDWLETRVGERLTKICEEHPRH